MIPTPFAASTGYLKTTNELAKRATLRKLAGSADLEELRERVREYTPFAGFGEVSKRNSFWHDVEWHKAADRGIVFLLQGVRERTKHHIWSCADKPPKCADGKFFKEANVPGLEWTLRELAANSTSVLGLVVILMMMGGS